LETIFGKKFRDDYIHGKLLPFSFIFASPIYSQTPKDYIILPILYGCEAWRLCIRKEHRLRVYESNVLRRVFGLERQEVTDVWKKLHSEELHN
jgi:hypothetical protein